MLAISTAHPTACAPGGLRLSRYGRWATVVPAGRSERGDAREEMAPVRRLAPLHESPSLLRAVLRLRRAPPLSSPSAILAVGGVVARRRWWVWCARAALPTMVSSQRRGLPPPWPPGAALPPSAAAPCATCLPIAWLDLLFFSGNSFSLAITCICTYSCRLRLILGPYALERVQLGFSGVNGGHNRSQ